MRLGWFALLVSLPAWAGKPALVVVTVTDALGRPIPGAEVTMPSEGELHRVNSETGTWTGTHLYLLGGVEVPLAKGTDLVVVASAAGYLPKEVTVRLKGKNSIPMALDTLVAPGLPCLELPISAPGGEAITTWSEEQLALPGERSVETAWCLLGARAVGATLAWQDRLTAYVATWDQEAAVAEASARRRAYEHALAWLEWATQNGADTSTAADLCRAASPTLAPCG